MIHQSSVGAYTLTEPLKSAGGRHTFEAAANLSRTVRRRGFTVRHGVDRLIAATCLEAGAELADNDRDFDVIARVSEPRVYRPA